MDTNNEFKCDKCNINYTKNLKSNVVIHEYHEKNFNYKEKVCCQYCINFMVYGFKITDANRIKSQQQMNKLNIKKNKK